MVVAVIFVLFFAVVFIGPVVYWTLLSALRGRWRPLWLLLAGLYLFVGGWGAFFGGFLAAAGGLDWLPGSFEWPVGRANGVVRTSEGLHVVPHPFAGRVQVYDAEWNFLRGWPVRGGPYKVFVSGDDRIHVVTAKGGVHHVFDTEGDLICRAEYRPASTYASFPEEGGPAVVPTAPWLWIFSGPLVSWAAGAVGALILIAGGGAGAVRGASPPETGKAIAPLTVQVGSRAFTVAGSPVPRRELALGAGGGGEQSVGPFGEAAIVRPDAQSLVVRPPARLYGRLLALIASGVAGVAYFGTAAALPEARAVLIPLLGEVLPTWPLVLLAGLSLLWLLLWDGSILFGSRHVLFDARSGRMTFGPVWSRQGRALSEIVAVQLLPYAAPRPLPLPGGHRVVRHQVNLVIDGAGAPRVNVLDVEDGALARLAGRQLADLLGAPFVDQSA